MRPPFQNRQMTRSKAPPLLPVRRRPPSAIGVEALEITNAQQKGGAGLLADETLRHFQMEYTNRVISYGRNAMPTSYEVLDAFFEYRRDMVGLFLLPEKDYIFSFADFLDFVTGTTAPVTDLRHLQGFESGVICNATSKDAPGGLLLETQGTSAYGVRAASMVRKGDYLTVMLCLAEQLPDDRLDEMVKSSQNVKPNPLKLALHNTVDVTRMRPAFVPGTDLLTTFAMVRFDLKSGQIHSRCLLRDLTESFQMWTDIVNTRGFPDRTADHPSYTRMGAELDESDAVWEVAKTLTLLPAYLEAKIAYVTTEQKPTPLGISAGASARMRRDLANVAPPDKVLFRTIAAIEAPPSVDRNHSMNGRSYSPPSFQVPVVGFWRVYSDQSRTGHDQHGNPVEGKTWVRSHVRHKDKDEAPVVKIVYIKASLSDARKRLAQYRADAGIAEGTQARVQSELPLALPDIAPAPVSQPIAPGSAEYAGDVVATDLAGEGMATGAFVYVMRCHAHTENLFKVGFTDRDPKLRAKELSSTTSVPSPFMVLQAWAVSDGYGAEQSAHAELTDVRLSANREFFQLDYRELCLRLEQSLKGWLL
jgi:hypothetical protein